MTEEIEKICDDLEMNVILCPWKGTVTLTKTMQKDTTWSEPESGEDTHKTQQSANDKEVYKFRIYSASISSCNVDYQKISKIIQTDKWNEIRCWAPNGDARYPAKSTAVCIKENTITGNKEIKYASVSVENATGSEQFKINLGIPDQVFKAVMSERCTTEDDCNAKKEDIKSFAGDANISLSDSYMLEGLKKGSNTFNSRKTFLDAEGLKIILEWELKK